MNTKLRKRNPTQLQYRTMLDTLEQQLRTNTSKDAQTMIRYWKQLAVQLNALDEKGLPRSAEEWQIALKCWVTMTQAKAQEIDESKRCGGSDAVRMSNKILTPIEQRLLTVFAPPTRASKAPAAKLEQDETIEEILQTVVKVKAAFPTNPLPLESVFIAANPGFLKLPPIESDLLAVLPRQSIKSSPPPPPPLQSCGISAAPNIPEKCEIKTEPSDSIEYMDADDAHDNADADTLHLTDHIRGRLAQLAPLRAHAVRLLMRRSFDDICAEVQLSSVPELDELLHQRTGCRLPLATDAGRPLCEADGESDAKELLAHVQAEQNGSDRLLVEMVEAQVEAQVAERDKLMVAVSVVAAPVAERKPCATCHRDSRFHRQTQFSCHKCVDPVCLKHSQVYRMCGRCFDQFGTTSAAAAAETPNVRRPEPSHRSNKRICVDCHATMDSNWRKRTPLQCYRCDKYICETHVRQLLHKCFRCLDAGGEQHPVAVADDDAADKSKSDQPSKWGYKYRYKVPCKPCERDDWRRMTAYLCYKCEEGVCAQHCHVYRMCGSCFDEVDGESSAVETPNEPTPATRRPCMDCLSGEGRMLRAGFQCFRCEAHMCVAHVRQVLHKCFRCNGGGGEAGGVAFVDVSRSLL